MADDEVQPPAPESVPDAVLETIEPAEEADATPAPPRELLPYLGFYVGEEVYGLPLAQLREVARLTRLRHIPGAPAGVAGLVNLRGEIVCALDVRAILGLSAQAPADSAFLVALRDFDDLVARTPRLLCGHHSGARRDDGTARRPPGRADMSPLDTSAFIGKFVDEARDRLKGLSA